MWKWGMLGAKQSLAPCNHLSILPRMATRRAPLTCWALTSGLPTPLIPSGKLMLEICAWGRLVGAQVGAAMCCHRCSSHSPWHEALTNNFLVGY